jgi:hypothetical protein
MQDKYFSFESEAQANNLLYTQVPVKFNEDREPIEFVTKSNYRYIDVIGVIYKPTGAMIEGEFGSYPEMQAISGWHANVRLMPDEDASALLEFEVQPETPIRVWA